MVGCMKALAMLMSYVSTTDNSIRADPYPLVVRLPCHSDHKFDLECITSWLTLKTTCPLDRKDLRKKKEPPPKVEDDEEDYDEMFA